MQGGCIALVSHSADPVLILLMLLRFIGGIALNSGQRLDNVNRAHLVLASGKLVLQKVQKQKHWRESIGLFV